MTIRGELPPLGESFRVGDALRAGASASRMRAADLARPHHGGRTVTRDPLAALVPLMRPDQAFAGPTAAKVLGIPLPARWEGDHVLHVASLAGDRMRRPGVAGSRSRMGGIVRVAGLPVLDPATAWTSLAGFLGVDDLVAAADRLLTGDARHPALVSADELNRAVRRAGRRRHVTDLREATGWMRVGAWSRPETLLRLLIVRAGFPEPALNLPVRLRSGSVVRPDLAWHRERIAIEYDGSAFHGRDAWDVDAARHERLLDEGWIVVRVRSDDLFRHPDALLARLRSRFVSVERAHSASAPR